MSHTTNLNGQLLDEHQVAAILHIKVSTLRSWRVKGSSLPFRRIGRAIRYTPQDVTAFIDAGKFNSTSEASHG